MTNTNVYSLIGLLIGATILTACDEKHRQELTKSGMAGYEFCLNNPNDKLYMGDENIYSCEWYLIRHKEMYYYSLKDAAPQIDTLKPNNQ